MSHKLPGAQLDSKPRGLVAAGKEALGGLAQNVRRKEGSRGEKPGEWESQ